MRGHLRRRGPGTWAVVVELGRDPEGKRRQKWHTVHGTKADAERELTRILHELDTGLYAEPERLTVAAYLERWLTDYARANTSPRTYQRYRELIDSYITPRIGHLALTKLRPLHVQGLEADLLANGRQRRREGGPSGLSPRTVLHVHRVLATALRQAVRWQMIPRNPADAVRPPCPTRPEIHTLTEEETALLLQAAKGSRLYAPVLLALTTGLRRGELLALRWEDVDLESGTLRVVQNLTVTQEGLVFKTPKTAKSRRSVALPALAVEALREHRKQQSEERLRLGPVWQDHALVFPGLDGRPWHPDLFTSGFHDLTLRAGLRVRLHDLRHTHATQLLKAGIHPKVVSERLGHSTIGITLDIYSHVLPGMQEEAATRTDLALRAALKEG